MLSILIVNWNTKDMLRSCLASIATHPQYTPYEVIVVDNASKDGSAEMVQTEFPSVRLIASEKNTGYATGNNLAFQAARGEFLLTLNPDTEFLDDSLDRALEKMSENPTVGCLGVRLIDPDGSTQASVRGFPSVIGIFGDITGLGRIWGGSLDSYRLTRFDYDVEQDAPQPMGSFLLFRRTALVELGSVSAPFDERFPIFFNEVDLLFRLRKIGWGCLYTPGAKVLHHGGESTKQVRKSIIWESHRSLVRYLWKHPGTGLSVILLPLLSVLIYVAAFVRARGYHAGFGT